MAIVVVVTLFLPLLTSGARHEAVIRIPRNSTDASIRDSLALHLGDKYAALVMRAAAVSGTDFSSRHGAYLIDSDMSPAKAARRLAKGAQHPLTVTVNGFRSLGLLAQRLSRRLDFHADSLIRQATDPSFLNEYGLTPDQALSLFLDDSYEVYWSASPLELLKKIGANYRKVWNKERTEKAAKLGLTPAEIMTVCSIVDEETNKIDEKGKIGRLYINRLKKGMPLQADPTVKFALNDFTIKRLNKTMLTTDSPFNTYIHKGLPPGPIRTTSVRTIDEVLDSEPSDYLYMCAREDFSGYHNFAVTLDEHLVNARRYWAELDRLGIAK